MGTVQFGILGLVEVRCAGTESRITGCRQRELLVSLLLSANRVVPVADLVGRLWPADQPPRADRTLHTHVMRLRRVLQSPAADRIVTRFPGYLVQVGPGELDADRFDALRAAGVRAARRGDWRRAYDAACRALELWRGEPLLDVPSLAGRDEVAHRLAGQRLDVLEVRMDALIGLGGHAAAATELRSLVREHPLRERFAGQYMTALSLDGRRAEALAVYRQVHRNLVGELGVEPGGELRLLHQRILEGEPVAVRPAAATRSPARPLRLRSAGIGG